MEGKGNLMKGIAFGNYHTYNDFGLVIEEREVSAPEPKTHFVEIDGADGSLDFTEAFGNVKYKRRKLKYKVVSLASRAEFWSKFTEIQNALHGREFSIIDDEDPEYYYIGRVVIDKWSIDKVVGSFNMEVDAEPYKYHLYETQRVDDITGTMSLVYKNDRMRVNPTIRVSSPMTIVFEGKTLSINSSDVDKDFVSTGIIFKEGNNVLQVTGEGKLTIRYQEGSL